MEGGAQRPLAQLHHVVGRGFVIAAADVGDHLAAVVVDHQARPLQELRQRARTLSKVRPLRMRVARLLLRPLQTAPQPVFHRPLHGRIDRGVDPEAPRRQRVLAHHPADLIGHPLVKMRRPALQRLGIERKRRAEKLHRLDPPQRAEIDHPAQHQVARGPVAGRVVERRQVARVLDAADDRRALQRVEILRLLAEVAERGRADPVVAAAEVDAIEVELEDLVLRVALLDPPRQEGLHQLAFDAALVALLAVGFQIVGVARQLLGHRAGTLRRLARLPVEIHRAHHADVVDPVVGLETLVLPRPQRVDEDPRHAGNRDHAAVLHEDPADLLAVAVQDQARDFQIVDPVQIVGIGPFAIRPGEALRRHPGHAEPRHGDQQQSPPEAFALVEAPLLHLVPRDFLARRHAGIPS